MLLSGLRHRRTIRWAFWWAVFGLALIGARADTAGLAGTLPEDYFPGLKTILDSALKQSPQMLLRQIEIARNEAQVYEESSQRYPNVGGNVHYDSSQQSTTGSATSRNSGLFYSFSVNQAVFHWGEIKHRSEIAKINVAIAEKNYAEAYRALAVQIRQTYVGLVARNAGLRQARFALNLRGADLAASKERLAHGSASPQDIAVRELAYDEAQLDLDRQVAEFDSLRRLLSRLAGLSPDLPADQIPTEIPAPRYDPTWAATMLSEMMRDGGKNSLKAQAAELSAQQADLSYRIARVRLLPKFNASIGHERNSWTTVGGNSVSQTAITNDTIEIRGDWSIFDGFATKGAKLEALAQKRAAERQRDIEAEAAMDEAQRLERTVSIDARAMQFAERHQAGAAAGVERARQDVQAGRASQGDIDAAISLQRYAEWNLALARNTFLSDWSAFVSLVSDDPALNNLPSSYVSATR